MKGVGERLTTIRVLADLYLFNGEARNPTIYLNDSGTWWPESCLALAHGRQVFD